MNSNYINPLLTFFLWCYQKVSEILPLFGKDMQHFMLMGDYIFTITKKFTFLFYQNYLPCHLLQAFMFPSRCDAISCDGPLTFLCQVNKSSILYDEICKRNYLSRGLSDNKCFLLMI